MSTSDIASEVLAGNRRALARLISMIENEEPTVQDILRRLYRHTGRAHIVGITGPPGSGKSSIVAMMTSELRRLGRSVGIVCVDPSSPFTGGALLGDRIRIQEHSLDDSVYMRSMGTRGHLGGLSRATSDAVRAIDASGKDMILVETVGAGQSEVEVIEIAHTVIVTDVPSSGDDIQAIKAGIMEIADIFVVNKMDLPGADKKVADINAMIDLDSSRQGWRPPVLLTNARTGEGIPTLVSTVDAHLRYLRESGLLEARALKRTRQELQEIMEYSLTRELLHALQGRPEYEDAIRKISRREDDPYSIAQRLIAEFLAEYSRR
ncbi:MAG: methylmalonyl Co-A mutase-associated GTPase MeaB [Candidatus Thorarchaeota archaeon]